MRNSNRPSLLERLVAAGSYVTMGLVGFVWLILCAVTRRPLSSFLKYHIFQSFFLIMGLFLLKIFVGMIVNILCIIPFINMLVYKILFLFTAPMIFGHSIVNIVILVLMVYLALTSLQGRYSYLPWISNIIDSSARR